MLDIFTIAFFGHRDFNLHFQCENQLKYIIRDLMYNKEYVEFLVGRNGEFDVFVSSVITKAKEDYGNNNSSLTLVMPYYTKDLKNNIAYFQKYYDEIEICEKSSEAHYKSAITIRNREMIDKTDLIICFVMHSKGGAYQAMKYAKKTGKTVINLATDKSFTIK